MGQIAQEYSKSFSPEQLEQVAKFAQLKGEPDRVASSLSESKIDASSLLEIVDSLKSRGIADTELNLSVVRGIDYYTDMVFEAVDRDNPRLGSLCGGGRYDSLPAIYGRPEMGATGVAGGVERAVLAYKFETTAGDRVFVASIGTNPKLRRTSISIAAELRRSGIPAQAEITERSLRKVLEAQSQAGVRAVIIVGERELAADSVKIKWMKTGEEVAVRLSDIVSSLQE